ncbi:hypothetical protein ACI703_14450 [Isoptericola jiangsuensis]|uniref:hypothetical protein n=1 Tax=Isoptericola jiangsuensis TaxID=548579 RepID=UPI00386330D4
MTASRLRLLAASLLLASYATAAAQSPLSAALLSDSGWHGVRGGGQLHQPSLSATPPAVDVWQRIPLGNHYGAWSYRKLLIDCAAWTQLPFMTMDSTGRFTYWGDTSETIKAAWAAPALDANSIIGPVCGLYGYTKPRNGSSQPASDQSNYVERVDKPAEKRPSPTPR